jgi:protein-L-isoaspartate(D-aspartate) O-methyltransferase
MADSVVTSDRRASRWSVVITVLSLAATGLFGCAAPSESFDLPTIAASAPAAAATELASASPAATESASPEGSPTATLDRQLSDTDELRARRQDLVDQSIASYVDDEWILDAFRTVPRHAFVPTDLIDRAYADFPLPIGYGQTISQPSLVALMTDLLAVEEGHRVLEIGTGSGYQAAILREVTDQVYSVEIIPELSETARAVLEGLGYDDVNLDRRDGYLGWAEEAPFDSIIVTAAPDHLPQPLVDQLRPDGGRMVIPIGPVGDVQTLWLVTRQGEEVAMEEVIPVAFVPLTREDE